MHMEDQHQEIWHKKKKNSGCDIQSQAKLEIPQRSGEILLIIVKMGENDMPEAEVGWEHPLPRQSRNATCSWEYTLEKERAKTMTWVSETEA